MLIDSAVKAVTWVSTGTAVGRRVPSSVAPLVGIYVALVVITLVVLAVLAGVAPAQATVDAWGHAMIVAVFAVLLPLRARSAVRGSAGALRAVGVIAAVLVAVNVVEALLPGAFPGWMRGEMAVIAVLMATLAVVALRRR